MNGHPPCARTHERQRPKLAPPNLTHAYELCGSPSKRLLGYSVDGFIGQLSRPDGNVAWGAAAGEAAHGISNYTLFRS